MHVYSYAARWLIKMHKVPIAMCISGYIVTVITKYIASYIVSVIAMCV